MPRRTSRDDPNQLKMFMTPEEIHKGYEPLEGDFEESPNRPYERTHRVFQTGETGGKQNAYDPNKSHYGFAPGSGAYVRMPKTETHGEFWDRKREEAQMDPIDYAEARQQVGSHTNPHFDISAVLNRSSAPKPPEGNSQGNITDSRLDSFEWHEHSYLERKGEDWRIQNENRPSIYESVQAEGVKKPVHLSTQFIGPGGKNQIVGGHHRLASSKPGSYIPVEHHTDLWAAQESEGYT